MNRVCACNMVLFEVDTCMSFRLETLLQFIGTFGHNSAIETIRGGWRRTFFGCLNSFGVFRMQQPMPILYEEPFPKSFLWWWNKVLMHQHVVFGYMYSLLAVSEEWRHQAGVGKDMSGECQC